MFYNIKFNLAISICIALIPILAGLYFLIYRKYNKRNELAIYEIINNMFHFVAYSVVAVLIFIIGLDYYLEGMYLIEAVYERYAYYTLGVLFISIDLFSYYKYIKKSFIDITRTEKIKSEENTRNFAEHVILIFLLLMIISPIINLPRFARLVGETETLVIEMLKSLGYMVIGIFLLNVMNPLEILYKNEEVTKKLEKKQTEEIIEKISEKNNDKVNNNDNKTKTKVTTDTKVKRKKEDVNKIKKKNNSKKKSAKTNNKNNSTKKISKSKKK